MFVQPTYVATSLLRVEPAQPEIFGALRGRDDGNDTQSRTFMNTQLGLIISEKVLNPVVADSVVAGLSWIKKSQDPKQDLRKKLLAEIVDCTNLISVTLELTDPEEAVAIVKSVIQSYLSENNEYSRGANRDLTESLKQQLVKLGGEITAKKSLLRELVRKGKVAVQKPEDLLNSDNNSDSTQPNVQKALGRSDGAVDRRDGSYRPRSVRCGVKARSTLAASEANAKEPEQRPQDDRELDARIIEEFNKNPDVLSLVNDLNEKREYLEHTKGVARQSHDPARIAAQQEVAKLEKQYRLIWEQSYETIRLRLRAVGDGSADGHPTESTGQLSARVAELKRLKEKQAALFKDMQIEQKESNDDTFEATYLTKQIDSLMHWEEQVRKNLEQLTFEANQDKYRVVMVDPASASKVPSNNKQIKYMAVAPVGVLILLLSLFLLLEIKDQRVADPDALSNRVRSEVYALPPLPTARSIRKLSESDADDQIEQFVQRLDHLRFALCGNSPALGKGRCVLITSAISGEGKTTLAAQLAARCGSAGMSTLLIDSDFRRPSLCPLLDVPEGPGLSDVLKDEASIDQVVIPVRAGVFQLLRAGTPIQDTCRLLQSPKFGELMLECRQLYDLIIIDSSPVLPVPDALILGRWADGAVIAARYDISRFPQIERARRQLDNAGIAVLGTVINGMRQSESYYGRYAYKRRRSNQPDTSSAI